MDKPNGTPLEFDGKVITPEQLLPVDGAQLLDEIVAFSRRYVWMSEAQAVGSALWAAHTYVFKLGIYTPYLAVTSATKRCGKSRLQETLAYLVRKPWTTASVSAASLYREIDTMRPTLFLDELDALFGGDKEMAQAIRGVLNSGNHHKGTVSRMEITKAGLVNRNFSTYCPKCLGGIGALPDTIADRSLHIKLSRKPNNVKIERLRERKVKPLSEPLRLRLEAWCGTIADQIRDAEPALPDELNDRQQDAVEILIAIADAAGGDWPAKARKALVELCTSGAAQDDDYRTKLLVDIKAIFDDTSTTMITCSELVDKLKAIETSPWNDWRGGRGLSTSGLGKLLEPFEVKARQDWTKNREKKIRLYWLVDFKPVFAAYLQSIAVHEGQPTKNAGETHIFDPGTKESVPRSENSEKPSKNAASTACTAIETGDDGAGGTGTNGKAKKSWADGLVCPGCKGVHGGKYIKDHFKVCAPFDRGAMLLTESYHRQGKKMAPELEARYAAFEALNMGPLENL